MQRGAGSTERQHQQESGPSEFEKWLEDYDKKYEDPTLEAAEQRKADNASFLSL